MGNNLLENGFFVSEKKNTLISQRIDIIEAIRFTKN